MECSEKCIYIFADNNSWYVISKENNKLTLFTTMPDSLPKPSGYSCCAVALNSVIYAVPETSGEVYFMDTRSPNTDNHPSSWKKGPSRRLFGKKEFPHCVVLSGGSIFVVANSRNRNRRGLDDDDCFLCVEILDPLMMESHEVKQCRRPMPNASDVSFAVAYGGKKVLVHFETGGALYCYDVDANSWDVIDEKFDSVMNETIVKNSLAVVGDVLYCFARRVRGYDLVRRRWFNGPVKGLNNKRGTSPYLSDYNGWGSPDRNEPKAYLVYVGQGKLCLVWSNGWDSEMSKIHCTKFRVCKDGVSLHAIIESFQIYTMDDPPRSTSINQLLAI